MLYIKSQDGTVLFPMNEPIMKRKDPCTGSNWWEWGTKKCEYDRTIESKNFILGRYRTKEKRDEVWDDIMNWLEYQYTPIFVMPQDKDKEDLSPDENSEK